MTLGSMHPLDAVGGEHFVDAFPDGWLNGFEALIEKGVVHDRLLPRANEVLKELAVGGSDDGLAVGKTLPRS